MSVELRPLGVKCNIQCRYCYQSPQRDAGNITRDYNIESMKKAILEDGGPFTLFGGEPLLVPLRDLEELWSWGLEQFGENSVQTNGALITDAHIRLFKRYKVAVGISVDGPGELNDLRWHGNLDRTRRTTEKTVSAVERLCREGMPPGVITTLHRGNACREKLPSLLRWLGELDHMGVRSMRLHLLESENAAIRTLYSLSVDENVRALVTLASFQTKLTTLRFDLFADMALLLMGRDDGTSCVWNACDPYTTASVRGVEGDGQRSNCGRTNKDGIDFLKSSSEGFERYVVLYQTPQEAGGCKDCRFFLMCKGQCPGTAIDFDWRNKTEHCGIWMRLYELLEQEMLSAGEHPLSTAPDRKTVEAAVVTAWSMGKNVSIARALQEVRAC